MQSFILDEILEWSKERPGWQRDALRRIFATPGITTKDLTDLVDLCKTARGLSEPRKPQPLTSEHLAIKVEGTDPVSLISVMHHHGVNALAPEQAITFGPNLTIVYGTNAAGKSGYTRILKRACRSRSTEEILGDVLGENVPLKPQATIKFRESANEASLAWSPDAAPADALAAVSVFDAHCAPVYLRDKTDVAFRPFGLDVFDQLSMACGEIRKSLEGEHAKLDAAISSLPTLAHGTRARSLIDNLTSLTKVDDVRALATLSRDDKRRFNELREQQHDLQTANPKQRAKELSLRADRIDLVVRHLSNLTAVMGDAALANLRSTADSVKMTKKALAILRKTTLTPDLLPGSGEDGWRTMWEAAEGFSQIAYPKAAFPFLSSGARCPLCQQVIGSEAGARLKHFAEYVSSTAQAELRKAEREYAEVLTTVTQATINRDDIVLAINELASDDADLADRVRNFLEDADRLKEAVSSAASLDVELPAQGVGAAPDPDLRSSAKALRDRVGHLQTQATAMEPKAAAELAELEARASLNVHIRVVEGEIERKKRLAAYKQCLDDTSTQQITRKSTELTKRLVTDRLRNAFQTELSRLEFKHLAVEIQPAGGEKGSLYHRLIFTNAPGIPVTNVLSEGESRALSLAAFLTELSTAASRSAVIFDDPVSSLDHIWRERIARRLVSEAGNRQVIVFTHDIVFLRLLLDESDRRGTPCHHQYVRRDGQAGISSPDLPWIAMNVRERIAALRNRWQATEKLSRTVGNEAYEKEGRELYGMLREAWEQAVSEVLLNDVVERYRHSIETQKVRHLHDISQADCTAVDDAMIECSRWIRGHDQAAADGTPFPRPDELKKRIQDLDDWTKAIRKRRN
ncbi:MAG TPA: AAA family ATPase [Candidatus Acidoferrales bacterium]|nr:AAA family ATPase [Candidatus Acidoferrales bacterium]